MEMGAPKTIKATVGRAESSSVTVYWRDTRLLAAAWLDTDTVADETWQTTATLNNPAFLPQLFTLSQTEKHLALITVMY